MYLHTEMACGVHLRILLICLVQAEHVRCLWDTQAQKQNSNTYVGSSQQDSGLRRLSGSYLQKQLRQSSRSLGSAQGSGLSKQTALSRAYSQGLTKGPYTHTVSQLTQSGYPSVRHVQGSSVSNPNWRMKKSNQASVQNVPKKQFFGLSTAIASGSSLSKYSKKQSDPTDVSKMRHATRHADKYLSSSSASVQSPRKGYSINSAFHQPRALKTPGAAAETPADYSRGGFAPSAKSSSLFGAVAPTPQKRLVQMQTSASGLVRRVSSRSSSKASKPSTLSSPLNERAGKGRSQTEVGKPYQSKLFSVAEANAQESYGQSLPVSGKLNAPASFQPCSLQRHTNQRLNYKLPSSEQIPSNSLQTSCNSRTSVQGARNLPASGSSRVGTSGMRFAPSRTYSIPQQFGGFAIRRLRDPDNQKQVRVRKPEKTYFPPSQRPEHLRSQVQSVHPESKRIRVRPQYFTGAGDVLG